MPLLWVPYHDVGVAARRDLPLPRVHAEDARRRGRGDLDEAIQRQLSLIHAVMVDQLKPVLDARPTVRNLGKVVLPEHLLVLETERTMVCGDDLQMIVLQTVPELRQVL